MIKLYKKIDRTVKWTKPNQKFSFFRWYGLQFDSATNIQFTIRFMTPNLTILPLQKKKVVLNKS